MQHCCLPRVTLLFAHMACYCLPIRLIFLGGLSDVNRGRGEASVTNMLFRLLLNQWLFVLRLFLVSGSCLILCESWQRTRCSSM